MLKTTNEIRSAFLEYFESKEHKVLPSSGAVPTADPSLMFTNAGMVQFKNVFVGKQKRPAPRACTVQKCIRISGKHNDLENVGRTSRHHTFFEMLGNFSFGDYFKEGACRFGWEFLTDVLGLNPDKLWISVFKGDENAPRDEEAIRIWIDKIGVSPDRILEGEAKDNFWSMGDTGPCGPCSEIMYDRGEDFGEASLENGERFFEIWNLVFMQYMIENAGEPMKPLPAPSIDTGAGLERIVSVLQQVDSNYDIDLFLPLIAVSAEVSGKSYGAEAEDDVSMRVIADHARMAAHLISEGVFPEKTGREYVLRRVMRRAIRHGHRLGIEELFFYKVANAVVDQMKDAYPALDEHRGLIEKVCRQEEERFRATLSKGLTLLSENKEWTKDSDGNKLLPGEIAFELSATYGFPLDLVEVLGEEEGFSVDYHGYEVAEAAHREASGAGKIGDAEVSQVYRKVRDCVGAVSFLGYDTLEVETTVGALIVGEQQVKSAAEGEDVEVVTTKTACYGESGGQVGDTGMLEGIGSRVEVEILDTVRPVDGLFVHRCKVVSGSISQGDSVTVKVDSERRRAVAAHHSATHLLHYAIRTVLGGHATQKGSRVSDGLLRFDFAHFEPVTAAEMTEIEQIVNRMVIANTPVTTTVSSYDDARQSGAMALFEENYGDEVRLVAIGDDSKELCGGTHVDRSGDVGPFAIVSEGGIAAGVRRIEAVCGMAAYAYLSEQRATLDNAARLMKCQKTEFLDRLQKMQDKDRAQQKEIDRLKREMASGGTDVWDGLTEVAGVKVLGAKLPVGDPSTLRDTADKFLKKMGSGVVCLAGDNSGKVALVVGVSKDLNDKLHAGHLVKAVAAVVGGGGGGRPDFAQAGGKDVNKIDQAVGSIVDLVAEAVGG